MQINHIKHLIFKNILGQATEGEKARLKVWLDESPANRELYEKLSSSAFIRKAITDDNGESRRSVWRKVSGTTVGTALRRTRRRAVRIAAILAIPVIAAATLLVFNVMPDGDRISAMDIRPGGAKVIVTLPTGEEVLLGKQDNISMMTDGTTIENRGDTVTLQGAAAVPGERDYTTYRTPRGGEYAIKLADGTIVTMNSESELRAPISFGKGERVIYFKGEGYFEVAHDPKRPFVVKANHTDVRVLGTEFNLRSYADETETVATLVNGSVEVSGKGDSGVKIAPGMQAVVSNDGKITTANVDIYPCVAWTSGRIVFENARVDEIMKVLRRWYNCDVYYGDEAVRERRFTMDILKYEDITQVLELMAKVNVHYEIIGDKVYINSK